MPYDLWDDEGGSKVKSNKPEKVATSDKWTLDPEVTIQAKDAPRRRPLGSREIKRQSNRAAVSLPYEGQSYNPEDASHQEALAKAATQLEKKRKNHEKFINSITHTGDKYIGNLSADKTWDEEVKETRPKKDKPKEDSKKKKKKKKKNKLVATRELRNSLKHKLHPNRTLAVKQLADIDDIKDELELKRLKAEQRGVAKMVSRHQNTDVKKFGRHIHQPLGIDVARTDELVGSLRTMKGGHTHGALERMKSFEERNLVPARMRHQYNKRKQLKPKGDLMVRKEPIGLANTTKRQ